MPIKKTILKSKTMSKNMLRKQESGVTQDQAYSQASAAHGLSPQRKEELMKNQVSQMVGKLGSSPEPSNANRLENYRVSFPDNSQIKIEERHDSFVE